MKNVAILFALCVMITQSLMAQKSHPLAGDWKGFIDIQAKELGIKTHFHAVDDGYSGTIDIPRQGLSDFRLQEIKAAADSVSWEMDAGPSGLLRFNGTIKNDTTIEGKFRQHGYTFPFQLHKEKPQKNALKQEHLPYETKQLIIKRDSIPIGGTLTLPEDTRPQKAVILISGSGAQNRDEEIYGFKPFAQIADYLTRHGIATFRFDDRGIGESGGDPNVGLNELMKDVQVIYDTLNTRQELSQAVIGLLGHSQGGYIADKLGAKNPHIGFIILMSGPSFPLSDIILQQTEAIEKTAETPDSLIRKGLKEQRQLFKAMQDNKLDSLQEAKISELEVELDTLSAEKKEKIGDLHTYAIQKVHQQLAPVKLPIFKSMIRYDPVQDIQKLHIPVLALFGEKDLQVLPEPNAERLRKALKKSNADYTIKIMNSANHLYQPAKTGLPSEYKSLPHHFVDDFLPTITQWIKQTGRQ